MAKFRTDLFVVIVVAVDFVALCAAVAVVAMASDVVSVAFVMLPIHFGSLL